MKRKKKRLPDFSKMSARRRIEWFDTHSLTEFMDDVEIVTESEALEDLKQTVLTVRIPVSLKRRLAKEARGQGLRGASSCARDILENHYNQAA